MTDNTDTTDNSDNQTSPQAQPYVAKVIHLRISVGPEDEGNMEAFVKHCKAALEPVAKTTTSLFEEYVIGGQRVRVPDYESGEWAKEQATPKPKKERTSESEDRPAPQRAKAKKPADVIVDNAIDAVKAAKGASQ